MESLPTRIVKAPKHIIMLNTRHYQEITLDFIHKGDRYYKPTSGLINTKMLKLEKPSKIIIKNI